MLEPLAIEGLTEDEAGAVQGEQLSGRPVQPHDRASGIDDEEGVVHAREDGLQLQGVPFVLERHLFGRVKTFDVASRLCRDSAQAQKMCLLVGVGAIALRGEHTEHSFAGADRDHDARLRRHQLPGFGAVKKTDRRSLGGPPADETRGPCADHLARETLAERERTAFVGDTAIHLTDDLHGLARFVVDGEEEDRGVHRSRGLLIERAEELHEVVGVGAKRSEPTRELESRAKLFVRGQLTQHVPPSPTRPRREEIDPVRGARKGPARHLRTISSLSPCATPDPPVSSTQRWLARSGCTVEAIVNVR